MHFNGADCIQYLPAGVGVVTIRISQNHAEGLFFIENFQLSSTHILYAILLTCAQKRSIIYSVRRLKHDSTRGTKDTS